MGSDSVDFLLFISKLLLYVCMLCTSGLVIVHSLLGMKWGTTLQTNIQRFYGNATKVLFVTVVLTLFAQIIQWIESFGIERINWTELLLQASTGQVLMAQLLIALLLLFSRAFDTIFTMILGWLLLLSEAFNGHIAGMENSSMGMLFDFIHVACIAIWIGGIIYMWMIWKYEKHNALVYLNKFTKILWVTIALASISGMLLVILLLPSWTYLLYTAWGQWLLVKIALIAVTVWCGYKVRKTILAGQKSPKKAMLIEASILAVIIAIATIIGQVSYTPSAANAINLHKMGEELHYTIKVTPNAPGPNKVSVTLWTLEEEGSVESVSMKLLAADKQTRVEHSAQLTKTELQDDFEFEGFTKSSFVLDKLNLPYPSKWITSVTITFADGHERSFDFTFSND